MGQPPSSNLPPSDRPPHEPISAPLPYTARAAASRLFPRKLALLFASSFIAFSITTWYLARMNNAPEMAKGAGSAESVVRLQLSALAAGESRVAYGVFTPRYRSELSFESFDAQVREHPEMFRTAAIQKENEIASAARSEITLHLESANGDRFIARYVLIVIEGRWWIDEMHWRADAQPKDRIVAEELETASAGANTRR